MPLSEEQKLKMALGRQRAAEARKAERDARRAQGGVDYAQQMEGAGHNPLGSGFAKELSQALGEFMVQHTAGGTSGVKQIAPAVFARMRKKWQEAEELLDEIKHSGGEKPIYELTADLFADDILIPASRVENGREIATRIRFETMPNETMIPKNEPARRVMALYMEAIGGKTPDLGETTMQAYLNRPRIADIVGAPLEQAASMGQPGTIAQASVEVLEDTPLEERTYLGPRKVLGTVQPEIASKY